MKVIKINLQNTLDTDIHLIANLLKSGKVLVLPTDTIYGLSAITTNKDSLKKIYKIKQRSPKTQKHLILLVSDFEMIKQYCKLSNNQQKYLQKEWAKPRALTVILKSKTNQTSKLISDDNGSAIRKPKNDFLLKLIKLTKEPIVSTSLNITGQKVLESVNNVNNYFTKTKPDIVIDAGPLPLSKPSRIIDIRNLDNINIIRN